MRSDWIVATVSSDNKAIIILNDDSRHVARVVPMYRKTTQRYVVAGYVYEIEIGGMPFKGKAKGARELIRMYPMKRDGDRNIGR